MKKINLEKKVWAYTILAWVINLKIFFLISNWEQTLQIWKYSKNIFNFYNNIWKYYFDFALTIPLVTTILTIIFTVTLFIFWFFYFKVYFYKLPKVKSEYTGLFGFFATIFTFLGFGCVACGQTLLTSLIFLFVSSSSLFLLEIVGNLVIIIGILLLSFGIYKNYKILQNKNLCKI